MTRNVEHKTALSLYNSAQFSVSISHTAHARRTKLLLSLSSFPCFLLTFTGISSLTDKF